MGMEFGEILRELLEDNDVTQKQMAADLNIAVSTLGNYVRDNREPDYKTLKRIADYFDVSVDYLLDHRSSRTTTHQEDRLLKLFHSLTPRTRNSFLDIGVVLLKNDKR